MISSIIVAMTDTKVIGKDNSLPWPRIKEDMRFFKRTTLNHIVIMGRKTYESIGKPLPKRINIVISRQPDLKIDGCWVVHSMDEALGRVRHYTCRPEINSEVFFIGGSSIYRDALPFVDRIYLTKIKGDYDGDTYFPDYDITDYKETVLDETERATFLLLEKNQ